MEALRTTDEKIRVLEEGGEKAFKLHEEPLPQKYESVTVIFTI
jgi:hypothetical protein